MNIPRTCDKKEIYIHRNTRWTGSISTIHKTTVFCSKHISNYQEKNDWLHHPSVLKISPVVPTWLLSNKRQPTWTSADHLKMTCINIYTMSIHGDHGLRACEQQFLRIACTSILKRADLYEDTMLPIGPQRVIMNTDKVDTDHLVWLTPPKKT